MVRSWSSTVELIGGSGGYLTCPVSPTVPIFAVNPAVAETLGNWDCPALKGLSQRLMLARVL